MWIPVGSLISLILFLLGMGAYLTYYYLKEHPETFKENNYEKENYLDPPAHIENQEEKYKHEYKYLQS